MHGCGHVLHSSCCAACINIDCAWCALPLFPNLIITQHAVYKVLVRKIRSQPKTLDISGICDVIFCTQDTYLKNCVQTCIKGIKDLHIEKQECVLDPDAPHRLCVKPDNDRNCMRCDTNMCDMKKRFMLCYCKRIVCKTCWKMNARCSICDSRTPGILGSSCRTVYKSSSTSSIMIKKRVMSLAYYEQIAVSCMSELFKRKKIYHYTYENDPSGAMSFLTTGQVNREDPEDACRFKFVDVSRSRRNKKKH